jgi:DNA-directed RNA polymerase subunit H (RpoH/RPB5)
MDIVITNCIKMLKARKYTNMEHSEEDNIITANDSSGKNVMVIILNEDRLNISSVKECIVTFATHDINIGILLYSGDPTSSAKKTLANLEGSARVRISIFPISNFRYCLTDHKLVFPHHRVKKDLSNQLKKKYGADKLPIILSSDPVAKYFNFRTGEIISITRRDGTVSFRIVK